MNKELFTIKTENFKLFLYSEGCAYVVCKKKIIKINYLVVCIALSWIEDDILDVPFDIWSTSSPINRTERFLSQLNNKHYYRCCYHRGHVHRGARTKGTSPPFETF